MVGTHFKNIFFRYRVVKHILFWFVYICLNSIMYGQYKGDYLIQFKLQLFYLPAVLGATYITLYILIPRYLLQKNYIKFISFFILTALFFSALQRINICLFVVPVYFPNYADQYRFFSVDIFFRILMEFPVVIFAALIKILTHWYQNQQYNQQLIQEKLEAELKFLKAQIHPHFLFNTLNNLYALTLKKSDLAPEMVLKLSELLNYMLYESNVRTISLKKEIDVLSNFIELEKIRYGDLLDIHFDVSGEIDDKQIAPLLLLPFVENSFKHGVSKKLSNKWVDISLAAEDSSLTLRVENSKEKNTTDESAGYTEGIGLKNVRRRLDLLYPQKHQLEIIDKGKEFAVILKLEINNPPAEFSDEN